MKLPNGHRAIIDVKKLEDYCLSFAHKRGRHKARLFAASLGVGINQVEALRNALAGAASDGEATPTRKNRFGQLYRVDFEMTGQNRPKRVLSIWIVPDNEQIPRLVTCYPL
ncbi:MAG: DUF6883 domain-containing protein [Tepidisphaeraceae bacterium]|jgi:hypothetical protein